MAGFGGAQQLPAGDYYLAVRDVKPTISKFKNPDNVEEEKEQYQFSCDAYVGEKWQNQTIWTPRRFTPPDKEATARFVSGLNRLTRACGMPIPRTAEEAEPLNGTELIGRGFILRMEQDPETPSKLIKRYLPLTFQGHRAQLPPNVQQMMQQAGYGAQPAPPQAPAPPPAAQAPPPPPPPVAPAAAGNQDVWA